MKHYAVVLFFAAGLAVGLFGSKLSENSFSSVAFKEVRGGGGGGGGGGFINSLLECEIGEKLLASEIKPFKSKVQDLVDSLIEQKRASAVSVYFRDLNNGPWFGINEKETFSPASLLKVPFMMAAFKQAEKNPGFLERQVLYSGPTNTTEEYFKSAVNLEPNKTYPMKEVIRHMIINSDNNAKDLVLKNLDGKLLTDIYSQLGVEAPEIGKTDDFITIKNYASFFRILFNSSYLNQEFSNKALSILSEVEFKNGLAAGVPENVKIAHKFGEREYFGKNQLHDCGIVYYPNRPYLLCVMNRGENFETLARDIADISKLTYKEVDKQFGSK